MYAIE